MTDTPTIELPVTLRAIRRGREWTQAYLGRKSNLKQSTISDIEAGKVTPLSRTKKQIARALKLQPEQIIFGKITAKAKE